MKENEIARERIERDTRAFLESGGRVQVCPSGWSGKPVLKAEWAEGKPRWSSEYDRKGFNAGDRKPIR